MGRRRAALKRKGKGGKSVVKRRRTDPNRKKEEGDLKDTKGKSSGEKDAAEISKPEVSTATGVHPLLIPHVLEKVLEHIIIGPKPAVTAEEFLREGMSSTLVLKNVKKLRLVCKQWKDAATCIYLRTRTPSMSFGNNWGPAPKSLMKKMQTFLGVMNNSDLIPVQRYTLNSSFFVEENQQLMKDFLRICGPDAVELNLYWDHSCTMKFTRRSFPDLNLMGLKTLSIQCSINTLFSKHTPTYEVVYLIEAVLSAAEAVQDFQFTLGYKGSEEIWPHMAVSNRFGDCLSQRIPKNVKILHLDIPLTDSHLNALLESDLKLEEFQYDSQCSASSKVVRKFIEKQTSTLKVLKIFDRVRHGRLSSSLSVRLDFPRFDELRHLDLGLWAGTIQYFSFTDTFPKLTSLNISTWETESTCVHFLKCCTKKAMSLTEIHLPYRFAQARLVKKVSECFPNIRKLHISPSQDISETLQQVFIYLDNIEELHINFTIFFDADSILSGVSPQDCHKIMRRRMFDDTRFRNAQHLPSILNLTKLRKLVLENFKFANLTDFLVRFVLLKMDSLNELHTNQCRISTKYVDLLREKLSLKLTGYPLVVIDDDSDADEPQSSSDDSD